MMTQASLSSAKKIKYSLAEIDAHCRRAGRGAGLPWGLAEEAGKAARWMASYNLDGPNLLAECLEWRSGNAEAAGTPELVDGSWEAKFGDLCPIIAGTIVTDRANSISSGFGFSFTNVVWPGLIIPQVGRAAEATGQTLVLEWEGFRAIASVKGLFVEGEAFGAPKVDKVTCRNITGPASGYIKPVGTGFAIAVEDWAALGRLAHNTYAPASEESRLSGAGAGLSDND